MYLYRGVIRIGSLGMIDDLAAVSLCGFDSVKTSAIINGKINAKRLKFNKNKCVKLHVSKSKSSTCCKTQIGDSEQKLVSCIKLQVHFIFYIYYDYKYQSDLKFKLFTILID